MADCDNWVLEDYRDQLDTREIQEESDTESRIQIRDHWIFIRTCKILTGFTFSSQVGKSRRSIEYQVGNIRTKKTLVTTSGTQGSRRYICTEDGTRVENAAQIYLIRRQTWEYYSPFRDPPDGWNVD